MAHRLAELVYVSLRLLEDHIQEATTNYLQDHLIIAKGLLNTLTACLSQHPFSLLPLEPLIVCQALYQRFSITSTIDKWAGQFCGGGGVGSGLPRASWPLPEYRSTSLPPANSHPKS